MDFEERARAVLPPHVSAYYATPASSEVDLDEGTVEWSAIRFRQRVLRDLAPLTLSTTVEHGARGRTSRGLLARCGSWN